MVHNFLKQLIFCLVFLTSWQAFGQSSVFSSGPWLKLAVEENAIIRLTYDDLLSAGLPVQGISPDNIRIFGNGSGMLPQENDSAVYIDPPEVAIKVMSQQAGSFQSGDYILFYAEGPDYIRFDRATGKIDYQNHLYTDNNYYFITIDQNPGKRITLNNTISPGAELSTGIRYAIHEEDLFNILHSGRTWYGEKFDLTTTQAFTTTLKDLAAASDIQLYSSVMSSSTEVSSFDVSINNNTVGSQEITANPAGTYARKGTSRKDWFSISQSSIGTDVTSVEYVFNKSKGVGYLDYFVLQGETNLNYAAEPLSWFTGNYAENGPRTVRLTNAPENLIVLDITDPNNPQELSIEVSDGTANFNISTEVETVIAFDPNNITSMMTITGMANQDIKSTGQVELLIITNPEFSSVAEQIAALRISQGITAKAVTDEVIYNEFSSGKKDITALRNYIRFLYENTGLEHVLMLGKGTYDAKNILQSGNEKLPIYQSRNSLFPLATYSSDDYLTFMEDHEGYWAEDGSNDHTMDLGIGRIPVTTLGEAEVFLDKLKTYQSKSALGNWRQKVVFVAENGDNNIHQRDAERLTTLIDTTYAAFTTNKIYVDAYPIEVNPGTRRAPEANKDIYESINSGALIVNYTGHGNEDQWANTRIFDTRVIDSLLNLNSLPLFVTATCEFGRHDDTGRKSGGEDLLFLKPTGAIATITTARPVFASSNYQLNRAFYNTVFERVGGSYQQLGDIFRKTKNNSLNGVLNRNFSLLGDPSMTLSYGEQLISLDSLNGNLITQEDTLKALELLDFSGSIRQANQQIDPSFSGIVDIKLYDRARAKQTLGQGNSPFIYTVRDNILFSGSATIANGIFTFETILPKDISYNPETARLVLYAYRGDSVTDASGANIDFLIGSSSDNGIVDNEPPEVIAYVGDTLFQNGDIVNENSLLIVKLYDEYGINTSSSQVGHSITYQLDNEDPVELNEFYNTVTNDFRTGWVYFNLPKMTSGKHTLKVTAWDTSNNSSTEEIEFTVIGSDQVIISNLSNYPNPMREATSFTFNHNLGGEDIEVRLEIMSTSGQRVYAETREYSSAPGTINDWQWDGRNRDGGKLISGIYIYGVFVRSNSSGLVHNQFSRLFISN